MSLQSGQRLAHYEVLEPLGKGGMGEVYRAKDGKLGRDVAIKTLPEDCARDEERLKRFQREALLLASLNHPHIAAIYGLEQEGDTHYLVLELVPGETLAERLARGPLPVDEALAVAGRIAEALEAAHERGIVHRDLKPANIKLTPDDDVKVLDFGLAKAFVEEGPEADSSMSPTLTHDTTRHGVILGTAAYMSPEQAKGKRVDRRADVWAFGAVLYEMLTGRKAFEGEDVSDTLAAVLRAEPDLAALPAGVPPAVRNALGLCLRKSPKERVRDIGDVRLAMEGAFETAGAAGVATTAAIRPGMAAALALVAALAAGVAVGMFTGVPAGSKPSARFIASAPPTTGFVALGSSGDLAVAPDGSRLVYSSGTPSDWRLYERRLSELEARPIDTSAQGGNPFFSPNGDLLGFQVGRQLKKVPLDSGVAVTVVELTTAARGATWGADDTIVFADPSSRSLFRVPASGGEPSLLLAPRSAGSGDAGSAFTWPHFLPGGRALLFTIVHPQTSRPEIAVLDLSSSEVRTLISPGTNPRYAASGHIVYGGGDGTLRAVRFDHERLEISGEPQVMLNGVWTKTSGAVSFALAEDGSMCYVPGDFQTATTLVWVDRAGREEVIRSEARIMDMPRVSPDGRRVALVVEEGVRADLYVLDLERGTLVPLTRPPTTVTSPLWTRDGSAIVFGTSERLYRLAADGAGEAERIAEASLGDNTFPLDWSATEDQIVFYQSGGPSVGDIYTLTLDSGAVQPLLALPDRQEAHPSLSPDGRWMAYSGRETGRIEIYVRPFPNVDEALYPISSDGGNEPVWSRDGREIFYWDDNTSSMMAVPVTTEPEFRAGVPTRLFGGDYEFPRGGRHYDVSADGQRFLMVKRGTATESADQTTSQVVVVQNWTAELERVLPND